MSSELEKQFFQCFGIEQKYEDGTCDMDDKCRYTDCNTCQRINKFNYPQISDRTLLELICIANQYEDYPATTNMKNIKERTLRILLRTKKCLKNTFSHKGCHNGLVRKVRTLFEEAR